MEEDSMDAHGAWAASAIAALLDACVGTLVMWYAAEVSELVQLESDE